jgi:phosphatidylglycerophosphate synthase
MLSTRAREAMLGRRSGARARVFLLESVRDSRSQLRAHRSQALEAAGVALGTGLAAGLAGALGWMGMAGSGEAARLLAWCLAGAAASAVLAAANAGLFATGAGSAAAGRGIGPANALTVVRFALIAPTAYLLASSRYREALGLYGLLIATDVFDGIAARVRREESPFGVVMDPLADVASTFAVFTVFVVDNLVPLWLYLLLVARYAMLLVGSLVLFLATGPIEFRATRPGKIVGVVQAAGVAWIMIGAGGSLDARASGPLFAFLGLGFASIVVSQAVIGWRHIRRASPRGRGWQGGSSR